MAEKSPKKVLIGTVALIVVLMGVMFLWAKINPAPVETDQHEEQCVEMAALAGTCTSETESPKPKGRLELPAPLKKDVSQVMLEKEGFTCSYNLRTHCANYVAWHLDKQRLQGNVERQKKFYADEALPEKDRVEWFDYRNTGYDRGHLCPSADNRKNQKMMSDCFLMTNICPQAHVLNEGVWNDLEETCRLWARNGDDVYIACGPVYSSGSAKKIGNKKCPVLVPDKYFKVVLIKGENETSAMGFVFPNDDCDKRVYEYAIPVDEVEKLTGMDFFCNLDNTLESTVESTCNPKEMTFVAFDDSGNRIYYDGYKKNKRKKR